MAVVIHRCPAQHRLSKGFTLIELLVAGAIGAVLAWGFFMFATTVMDNTYRMDEQAHRMRDLQTTMQIMSRDLIQITPRPVRDELGDRQRPALVLQTNEDGFGDALALTTAGWLNPTGRPRSSLQRIEYFIDEEKLVRRRWPTNDRTLSAEPLNAVMLDEVESIEYQFLDNDKKWHPTWPPPGARQTDPRLLPVAIEFRLTLKDWGELTRLIEVVN